MLPIDVNTICVPATIAACAPVSFSLTVPLVVLLRKMLPTPEPNPVAVPSGAEAFRINVLPEPLDMPIALPAPDAPMLPPVEVRLMVGLERLPLAPSTMLVPTVAVRDTAALVMPLT